MHQLDAAEWGDVDLDDFDQREEFRKLRLQLDHVIEREGETGGFQCLAAFDDSGGGRDGFENFQHHRLARQ